MPPTSRIPNRRPITLSVNGELVKEAKARSINISLLLDAALERELNPVAKDAFNKAIMLKNRIYDKYIQKKGLKQDFQDSVYGDDKNVVEEKKSETKVREPTSSFRKL